MWYSTFWFTLQAIGARIAGNGEKGEDGSQKIQNAEVVSMLIAWLPTIAHSPDQIWLAKSLRHTVCGSEKNRMICCKHGIIQASLKCVELTTQSADGAKTTGMLGSL